MKEEIKCNNIIKQYKNNNPEHNANWQQALDNLYILFIVGGSGYGKTNSLFNLADIDENYFYAKDPHEDKYQLLINS